MNQTMDINYVSVTEISGDEVSQEQIDRLCNRYYWASQYCGGKDVLEAACGSGTGLGYLSSISKHLEAGDYSDSILSVPRRHYGTRIPLTQFDALHIPYKNHSKDVIILFEAIYYLPDAELFVKECARVLRPNGFVLITTANKDLYDFNPSPYSYKYYGVTELNQLFLSYNFQTEFFGDSPLNQISFIQKVLRPVKKFAVQYGLIPKTMSGKKIFKRIVFGKLVSMPNELPAEVNIRKDFPKLQSNKQDTGHKIIFCAAMLR